MTQSRIVLIGGDALDKALKNLDFLKGPADEMIDGVATTLQRNAFLRSPTGVSSRLKSSWVIDWRWKQSRVWSAGPGAAPSKSKYRVGAVVGSNMDYAHYVEWGTKPHWPPLKALQPWASRHGFGRGMRGAWLLARRIAKKGTKASKFFEKARADTEPYKDKAVKHLLSEAKRRFGNIH